LELPDEQAAALQAEFEKSVRETLSGDRADLFLKVNQRFLDDWFHELCSCPLRIITFTPANSTASGFERLVVEFKITRLDSDQPGAGTYLYPEDETALGFQRFATLVRNYVDQQAR
jgi:hypothetical protein